MVKFLRDSRITREALEWQSNHDKEAEGRAIREALRCHCRKFVHGGMYMGQVSCRVCGKLR